MKEIMLKLNLSAKSEPLLFCLMIVITTFIILSFFILNGQTFPIPWDDESSFTLQAISWAESNTFFTTSLNNDRVIMWMNPAYMIFTGSIYKIFGYSFSLSREISWFFYIAAFLIFSTALRNYVSQSSILILAAIFLLPSSLASGNLARMEPMELFLSAVILLSLFHKRFWLGVAILIGCTLFHFNAVYLLIPILGAFGLEYINVKSFKSFYPNRWDLIVLGVCTLLLLAYFVFIFSNIEAFRIDMAYQFSRKFGRAPFYESPKNLFYIGAICGVTFLAFVRNRRHLTILGLLSLSFYLTYSIGQEMWYTIFCNLSLGLISIVLLNLLPPRPTLTRLAVITLILLNVLRSGTLFAGMKPSLSNEPYIDLKTSAEIKGQILLLAQGIYSKNQVTVSFMSRGVGMMFYPFLKANNLQLRYKLPDQITTDFPSEICIYITRSYDPSWLAGVLGEPTTEVCRTGLILSKANGDVRVFKNVKNNFVQIKN